MTIKSISTAELLAELDIRMNRGVACKTASLAAPIVAKIAAAHGLTAFDLTGDRGTAKVAAARDEAAWTLAQAGLSATRIAIVLHRRCHTTITKAIAAQIENISMKATKSETAPDLDYRAFIERKTHLGNQAGFKPLFMPDFLFPFQRALTTWAIEKGRAAMFADCGLGKTPMQLVWAQNVVEKTCKPVLILTPLSVGAQTIREAHKFGIEAAQSRDGSIPAPITVTNYQQLHKFDWQKFGGMVCDESSILKNFDGAIKGQVTEFMRKLPYRLLCTATAAPNDYIELGTSSEALGELRRVEMMAHFFNHDGGDTSKWRLKKHAAKGAFWQWICSWARAVRRPEDMGFDGAGFALPALTTIEHIVTASTPNPDFLFDMPAVGLDEQRKERRRTISERCNMTAELINSTDKPAIAWCHLNEEGNTIARLIPDAVEICGADSDEFKEETFEAFCNGSIRVIVTKPSIAGMGLNFQHCAHQTFFPSHSFEQWYQSIRRSWRFGQQNPVRIDVISTAGEHGVLANMRRKSDQADEMFKKMVELINHEIRIEKQKQHTLQLKAPTWLF